LAVVKPVILRGIKRAIKTTNGRKVPLIAGHKLLYKCNLTCDMCPFWKRPDEKLLSIEEEVKIMDSLASAGVLFYGFEGGEPLLRRDLPAILKESHERFHTALVTNGWLLKARIGEIDDFLESLFVSLDGIGSLHDRLRGVNGSFVRAVEGIRAAKRHGLSVAISSTITRENIHQAEQMVVLAENLGVRINFQPAFNYSTAGALSPYGQSLLDTLSKLLELKKEGAPIVNSADYFSSVINSWYHGVPWTCKPWLTINIDPQGRIVMPCYVLQEYGSDFNKPVWELNITELWNRYDWQEYESCNKCALSCYAEPSLFSWTKRESVKDFIFDPVISYARRGLHQHPKESEPKITSLPTVN
jgi:radical SAM family uncharacterized protein